MGTSAEPGSPSGLYNNAPTCSAASLITSLAVSLVNMTLREDELRARQKGDLVAGCQFDFVVVGGGSAGCVLARRLVDQGWKVLLLESGGNEPDVSTYGSWTYFVPATPMNWGGKSEPEPGFCEGKGCELMAGRGLGGSGAINSMQYMRGRKMDLDNWAALGNEGWSYEEVLPYFKKLENYLEPGGGDVHGTGGPIDVQLFPYSDPTIHVVMSALRDKGLNETDINGRDQAGSSVFPSMVKDARRTSTNQAYLQPVLGRNRLRVQTYAHVARVLFDDSDKTVIGVEYIGVRGRKKVYAKKEVILCAGTFRSPQILMLSGIGPKETLASLGIPVKVDLPVGQNLQDCPGVSGAVHYKIPEDLQRKADLNQMLYDMVSYLKPKPAGPMASNTLWRVIGVFGANGTDYPNVQLRFGSIDTTLADPPECHPPLGISNLYYDKMYPDFFLSGMESRGVVTINSTNPLDYPLVYLNYLSAEHDIRVLLDALKFVIDLVDTPTFKQHNITLELQPGCEEHTVRSPEYWECMVRKYLMSSLAFVGTCAMGPNNDPGAVVDPMLRVRGVKGLRVVDASIMPTEIAASLYATTIMIAEKAADMIRDSWRAKNKNAKVIKDFISHILIS